METYSAVEAFIDYATFEDNDLPYGGLVDDAPPEAVKAYEEYVRRSKEAEEKGIAL